MFYLFTNVEKGSCLSLCQFNPPSIKRQRRGFMTTGSEFRHCRGKLRRIMMMFDPCRECIILCDFNLPASNSQRRGFMNTGSKFGCFRGKLRWFIIKFDCSRECFMLHLVCLQPSSCKQSQRRGSMIKGSEFRHFRGKLRTFMLMFGHFREWFMLCLIHPQSSSCKQSLRRGYTTMGSEYVRCRERKRRSCPNQKTNRRTWTTYPSSSRRSPSRKLTSRCGSRLFTNACLLFFPSSSSACSFACIYTDLGAHSFSGIQCTV